MSERSRTKAHGRNNKSFVFLVMMIILLLVFIVLVGIMLYQRWQNNQSEEDFSDMRSEVITEEVVDVDVVTATEVEEGETETVVTMTVSIPQLDLDWDLLLAQNEDIYAWIYIPNTNVDYPVLQHPTDDTYYLNYNLDGSKGYPGCIYSELANSKDFTDSVTVLYGHNMRNGTMFRTLHYYEEEDFFNDNPYIYVYMPDGEVLVYEIYTAGQYTNAHIINSFGTDRLGLKHFLEDYEGNRVMSTLTRDGLEVNYNSDRVLVLSTCISGQSDKRYLVCGVVIYDGTPDGSSVEVEVEETSGTEIVSEPEETEASETAGE